MKLIKILIATSLMILAFASYAANDDIGYEIATCGKHLTALQLKACVAESKKWYGPKKQLVINKKTISPDKLGKVGDPGHPADPPPPAGAAAAPPAAATPAAAAPAAAATPAAAAPAAAVAAPAAAAAAADN